MSSVRTGRVLVAALALAAASCGDNLKPADPDAAVDASAASLCGNGRVDDGEHCDDGDQMADVACDATCHFTCGNGVVESDFGELCDPGIAGGAGACPTACSDGMACTQDVLAGSGCQAECSFAAITAPASGDGCCPAGATSLTDDDCDAACGNGVVEAGELCDPGILGGAGACPVTCDDGMACTTDALAMGGTCQANCTATAITQPVDSDGCCPAGANSGNDSDCRPGCGNGVVDPGETCDTAILVGPGACPTTCSDGQACTRDVLVGGGTCTAACSFPAITQPAGGDGCCPAGANANNDSDCAPVCGNSVVEPGEQCDDGNNNPGDACDACMTTVVTATAFRFTDLDLRDPHVYVDAFGCRDVTDTPLLNFSVNGALQENIQTDGDNDGLFDLSPTLVFRPYTQTAGASAPLEVHFADCTATASPTCRPGGAAPVLATATNGTGGGACLAPLAGTTTPRMPPYSPAITSSSAPCFASTEVTVTIDLSGIPITLRNAQVAATYSGNPATTMVNGLLRGFISEADANATILPASLPVVGGQPLSVVLPGGNPPGPRSNCAAHDDRDTYMGVRGWWFYLNFTARRVTWMD